VWGSSATEVWASCPWGLYRWDGMRWAKAHDGELSRLWGTGCTDIWAVGRDGNSPMSPLVLRGNGAAIEAIPNAALPFLNDANQLNVIWGGGPDDVWLFGKSFLPHLRIVPLVLHWDGSTWFNVPAQ